MVVGFGTSSSTATAWASTVVSGNHHYSLGLRRTLSGVSSMQSWSNNLRISEQMVFSVFSGPIYEVRADLPNIGGTMQMHARW